MESGKTKLYITNYILYINIYYVLTTVDLYTYKLLINVFYIILKYNGKYW